MPVGSASRTRGADRADLVAWARQAHDTGVDCPMSPDEAQVLLKTSNGAEGEMASAIGCMCSVELTCDGYRRESCPLVEPSARLAIHHARRNRIATPRRSADRAMETGCTRPVARRSRRSRVGFPLPPPDRNAYLATVDQRMYISKLEDDNKNMAEMIAEKLWSSLDTYHGHAHTILADLEKRTCGAHSTEGRALVAKIDATFSAHRKEMANSDRVDRRIYADPLFRRLEQERDSLNKQLAELEHAHGPANEVCTSRVLAGRSAGSRPGSTRSTSR